MAVAVVGAHLSGMPLNGELQGLGARLSSSADRARLPAVRARRDPAAEARTAARGGRPGTAIEVEIWALPAGAFGRFVAAVPAPLSIGTVRAGRRPQRRRAFWSRPRPSQGARDISSFGGWRDYMAQS